MVFWSSITCFAICALIYGVSDFLSKKTKGVVSSLLFACVIFLAGFWSGIFPSDITAQPGLVDLMSKIGTALMITNLGTLISLEDMVKEWKTVLVSIASVGAIVLICFTLGTLIFGKDIAMTASGPLAGSTVAGIIASTLTEGAERPELAAFVVMILALQKFFGIPVATFCLRKEIKNKMKKGDFDGNTEGKKVFKLPSFRIIPERPNAKRTTTMYLAKLAIVAAIATLVGNLTRLPGEGPANYILNPNIACLLFGLIFARIGFLEVKTLEKGASNGILTLGLLLILPGSLAKVTPSGLAKLIAPTFGMLILAVIAFAVVCSLLGKLLGYSPWISTAIGSTCLLAYPATQIISNECTDNMEASEEVRARASEYILPKMIVGGFVTVTILSVIVASVLTPLGL
ncbi:MAG: hypothetical protein LBQ95_02180 [Lachnospiraceae bacterium]|jgi:hypothetical protein|nr:hypothetical protein [Lachnospiraceae bacterium]